MELTSASSSASILARVAWLAEAAQLEPLGLHNVETIEDLDCSRRRGIHFGNRDSFVVLSGISESDVALPAPRRSSK